MESSCAVTNRAGIDNQNFSNGSSEQNRALLINQGVLPSHKEAIATFWSLNDQWWRQIIDGHQHQHGSMVFDEGSHGGSKEPGYLKGVQKASEYFMNNCDKMSIDLYKKTHSIACSHFEIKDGNGIVCNKEEIDLFRTEMRTCSDGACDLEGFKKLTKYDAIEKTLKKRRQAEFNLSSENNAVLARIMKIEIKDNDTSQKELREATEEAKELLMEEFEIKCDQMESEEIFGILHEKLKEIRITLKNVVVEVSKKLNQHFKDTSQKLGFAEPFTSVSNGDDGKFKITYRKATPANQFEQITEKLIRNFNDDLERLQKNACDQLTSDDKPLSDRVSHVKMKYQGGVILLIAQLFAELEWAHPWNDGQGRTDLVMLNGLLSREGLHPCILEYPYYSTGNDVNSWVDYLKQGLFKFKKLRSELSDTLGDASLKSLD